MIARSIGPVLATILFAEAASAQNAGDYYQPQITTKPGCATVKVRWAPSPYPTAPYPAMNILRASLDNSAGKLVIVNMELETSAFNYIGRNDCPLWITLPPNLTIGQGFYGAVARLQGFKTPGYTHFGIRTAGSNPNRAMLIASGPNMPDKDVQLGDVCKGVAPKCEFILRALLIWHEPQ